MQFSTCLPQHSNRRKKTSDMHTKKNVFAMKIHPTLGFNTLSALEPPKKNAASHAHKTRKVSFRVWKAAPNCPNLTKNDCLKSPLGNTPEFSVHQTCLFSLPAFYQNNSKNHKILTKIDKISFVFINENDKISSKSVFSARGEHSTPMSGG